MKTRAFPIPRTCCTAWCWCFCKFWDATYSRNQRKGELEFKTQTAKTKLKVMLNANGDSFNLSSFKSLGFWVLLGSEFQACCPNLHRPLYSDPRCQVLEGLAQQPSPQVRCNNDKDDMSTQVEGNISRPQIPCFGLATAHARPKCLLPWIAVPSVPANSIIWFKNYDQRWHPQWLSHLVIPYIPNGFSKVWTPQARQLRQVTCSVFFSLK